MPTLNQFCMQFYQRHPGACLTLIIPVVSSFYLVIIISSPLPNIRQISSLVKIEVRSVLSLWDMSESPCRLHIFGHYRNAHTRNIIEMGVSVHVPCWKKFNTCNSEVNKFNISSTVEPAYCGHPWARNKWL